MPLAVFFKTAPHAVGFDLLQPKPHQHGGRNMNQKFNLTVLSSLPLKEGFSLDELVIEVRRMFEEDGMVGLINIIIMLLDLVVVPPLLGKWDRAKDNCCDCAHSVTHQRESKRVRSSAGRLTLNWTQSVPYSQPTPGSKRMRSSLPQDSQQPVGASL